MTAPMRTFRHRPTGRRTFLRWAQFIFLTLGLMALGYYGYVQAEARLFQSYQEWRLDQLQQGKPASATQYVKQWIPFLSAEEPVKPPGNMPGESVRSGENSPPAPRVTSSHAHSPEVSAATVPEVSAQSGLPSNPLAEEASLMPRPTRRTSRKSTAEGALIGRIEIPRIHLRAIVMEGIDSRTLRVAAGHLPGTALPGEPGNVDIAAHRDTFFRGLRNIRRDDLITLSTASGNLYRYRVGAINVVAPNNTGILEASSGPGVNLITCYPFNYVGSAPKRFVVHADEISDSAGPAEGPPSALTISQPVGESAAQHRPVHESVHAIDSRRAVVAAKHRKSVRRAKPRPLVASRNEAPSGPTIAHAAPLNPAPPELTPAEPRPADAVAPEVATPVDTNSDTRDPQLPDDHGNRSHHPKVRSFFRRIFRRDKS